MVPVALPGAPYDIVLGPGLLGRLPELLQRYCPAAKYAVVTDSHVADLYGKPVCDAAGKVAPAFLVAFPAGEWNKTRETWANLTDGLLSHGVGRDGAVVALGGGVVGDVAGFVAATYLRGIPCVQLPTTVLAMIDSSVGGKTGVDTPAGKNLVGAFHQPRAVLADIDTLASLPRNQLQAGMAEALKHGAIADRAYFERTVAARDALLNKDPGALTALVQRSVEIKAGIVAEDERETSGRRAVLNFGHTVGHAVESAAGYQLLHGEAVAIGMRVEAELGADLGITPRQDAAQVVSALQSFGLPTDVPEEARTNPLLEAMRHDKKTRAGEVRASLIRRIGEPARGSAGEWTLPIPEAAIRAALDRAR